MNPLDIIKSTVGVIILAGVVWLGWDYDHCKRDLAVLQAIIEASDAQAQETVTEQEKNHDEIAKSHSDNVASVVAFYARMLRDKDKAGSSAPTERTQVADGIPSQCGTCTQDIGFQQACALDAIQVLSWQDWARLNHFPVK